MLLHASMHQWHSLLFSYLIFQYEKVPRTIIWSLRFLLKLLLLLFVAILRNTLAFAMNAQKSKISNGHMHLNDVCVCVTVCERVYVICFYCIVAALVDSFHIELQFCEPSYGRYNRIESI